MSQHCYGSVRCAGCHELITNTLEEHWQQNPTCWQIEQIDWLDEVRALVSPEPDWEQRFVRAFQGLIDYGY